MTTVAVTTTQAVAAPAGGRWTAAQFWGGLLLAPYVLVFLVFVLYPVGYGFWIVRRPESFVHLFDDPIFARSMVNTLVFIGVGINLKMAVALLMSDFFVQARRWIQLLAAL